MTAYTGVVLASWSIFAMVWAASAGRVKPSRRSAGAASGAALRVALVLLALIAARYFPALPWATGVVAAIGCALCALGIGCAVWARLTLGPNWGMPMTLREDPEVVMHGPYAYVRHPIYSGVALAVVGSVLVAPRYLAPAVALIAYFGYSAFREEKDLLARFPVAYASYRRRTKMFLPFVL